MAGITPLSHFWGQQHTEATALESPMLPHRHNSHGSRESRKELLRGQAQTHRSFIEPMLDPLDPMTPMNPADIVGYQPPNNTAVRRQHRYSDNNPYANRDLSYEDRGAVSFDDIYYRKRYDQRASRHTSRRPTTPHRAPYPEDNYSDDEEEARAYRRRPHRQHRRPPASYDRYGPMPGRSSLDAHQTARDDLLARGYSLYYDGDFEATSRRPRVYVSDSEAGFYGGGGGGGGRPPPPPEAVMRLPWTMWMNSSAKNHFVAFIGEFVGTTMFLFFAFAGTQVANIGAVATSDRTTTGAATGFSPTVLLYIAVVFGFSLMVNVWIFFRISGGLFNPAVTFAMLLCRAVSPVRATLLLVAQLAGSIFSSFLVSVMFPTSFNVRTTLSPGTSIVRGVFIEAILTAELVFTIFMLAKEKHKATFIAPVGIGLSLFIAELVGVYYTGGSLNPARSFGPCVVTGVFDVEHWIYWVGPGFGAIVAVIFYKFIKMLEYEVANPGQDDDDKDKEEKEEEEGAKAGARGEKPGLEGSGMERV